MQNLSKSIWLFKWCAELYKEQSSARSWSDNYTIQAAVDNKHNLIVATNTINRKRFDALMPSLWKINFGRSYFTIFVDKSYYNGREIKP
jgi:hypothetical protein